MTTLSSLVVCLIFTWSFFLEKELSFEPSSLTPNKSIIINLTILYRHSPHLKRELKKPTTKKAVQLLKLRKRIRYFLSFFSHFSLPAKVTLLGFLCSEHSCSFPSHFLKTLMLLLCFERHGKSEKE